MEKLLFFPVMKPTMCGSACVCVPAYTCVCVSVYNRDSDISPLRSVCVQKK